MSYYLGGLQRDPNVEDYPYSTLIENLVDPFKEPQKGTLLLRGSGWRLVGFTLRGLWAGRNDATTNEHETLN